MKHAIKFFKSIQLVDNGVSKKSQAKSRNGRESRGGNLDGQNSSVSSFRALDKQGKTLPICIYPPHHAKSYRHLLRDYTACPDHENEALFKACDDELAQNSSSWPRHLHTTAADNFSGKSTPADIPKVAGRLRPSLSPSGLSSFPFKYLTVRNISRNAVGPTTVATSQSCRRSWPGVLSWTVSADSAISNLSLFSWASRILTNHKHFQFPGRRRLGVLCSSWLLILSPW